MRCVEIRKGGSRHMPDEECTKKPPQNPSKRKQITQLLKLAKYIYFIVFIVKFWRLSVKNEYNSGGKFGQNRPLKIKSIN